MTDTGAVRLQGQGEARIVVYPEHYFDYDQLELTNGSVDQTGAAKAKRQANSPKQYVVELQTDLAKLGYLKTENVTGVYGKETERAVTRFQRHARRTYRMPGPADVDASQVFKGEVTGICDVATADELGIRLTNEWVNPVGRFELRALTVTGATEKRLRSDAATEWEAIVQKAADAGGILTGEANGYGDATRTLSKKVSEDKPGASSYSFHYSGRAVDIDQGWVSKGRYYIAKEVVGSDTFWRIYCKTEKQDGTQGTPFTKGQVKCFAFFNETEFDIRAGHYIDMTEMIEASGKFERIKPQKGFDDKKNSKGVRYNKSEWWHFQFTVDKQETFLDELELAGYTEQQARNAGWKTDAELDYPPG